MKIIKVNFLTLYFLLISFLCGYIKTALIILFIVVCHELGHIFFAKLFSYEIKDITIYPFGGITHIKKDINSPLKEDLLIAFGGVFVQTLLFLIPFPLSELSRAIFIKYNFAILIFNLLPIIPLDGSYILNALLNRFFPYKTSYKLYLIISFITIIFYCLFNYWYSLNNYFIMGLFIYKTYEMFKNEKYLYNKFLLERYLNKYNFKYISTKEGNLDILKKDTYQYFKEFNNIISEKKKLEERFDKMP